VNVKSDSVIRNQLHWMLGPVAITLLHINCCVCR